MPARVKPAVGCWDDRRTFRIGIDRNFDGVLRPLSKVIECQLLIEHRTAEMDDGCVRQATEFVDELAYCDDRGMGDDLVMTLAHEVYSFTLLLTGAEWSSFHSAQQIEEPQFN
jgi:hypothetical protein